VVKPQFGGGCRDKYQLVVAPCDAQSLLGHVVLFFNLPGMAKNAGGQKCTKVQPLVRGFVEWGGHHLVL